MRQLRILSAFSAVLLMILLTGCSGPSRNQKVTDTGFFFDTVVSVTLYGAENETLLGDCFSLMRDYENMFSRTRENSDIWNINHSCGKPVEVSEETAALLQMAKYYYELSEGAFDITVAPVVSLWDFTGESHHTVPSQEELQKTLSHVDCRKLEIHGTTVTLNDPEASIDPGGIAKGFIADRIKDFLEDQGIKSGLISLGGNVLTIGTKPDSTPWNIAIRKPFGEASESVATVRTAGESVVTSGTYERYFEVDGTLYHHILNPENGCPADNGLTSVTIISDSSAAGDALSTACFVLGPEKGMALVESLENTEALFITEDLSMYQSSGFEAQ